MVHHKRRSRKVRGGSKKKRMLPASWSKGKFKGSSCKSATCQGHKRGYEWYKETGRLPNVNPGSFLNGAKIAQSGGSRGWGKSSVPSTDDTWLATMGITEPPIGDFQHPNAYPFTLARKIKRSKHK